MQLLPLPIPSNSFKLFLFLLNVMGVPGKWNRAVKKFIEYNLRWSSNYVTEWGILQSRERCYCGRDWRRLVGLIAVLFSTFVYRTQVNWWESKRVYVFDRPNLKTFSRVRCYTPGAEFTDMLVFMSFTLPNALSNHLKMAGTDCAHVSVRRGGGWGYEVTHSMNPSVNPSVARIHLYCHMHPRLHFTSKNMMSLTCCPRTRCTIPCLIISAE